MSDCRRKLLPADIYGLGGPLLWLLTGQTPIALAGGSIDGGAALEAARRA
jgi:hypothetical protein